MATAATDQPNVVKNDETKLYQPHPHAKGDKVMPCPSKDDPAYAILGLYKIGDDVKAPKVIRPVFPNFTDEARKYYKHHKNEFPKASLVSFVVDRAGHPQDLCIAKPASLGLDEEAEKAVWQDVFEPASKDGIAVPVRMYLRLDFKIW